MDVSSAVQPHERQSTPQERGERETSRVLQALLLGHPERAIRDTARYPPLMLPRKAGGKARARGLRALAAEQLGLAIQVGVWSLCRSFVRLQVLACGSDDSVAWLLCWSDGHCG